MDGKKCSTGIESETRQHSRLDLPLTPRGVHGKHPAQSDTQWGVTGWAGGGQIYGQQPTFGPPTPSTNMQLISVRTQ